MTPEIVLGPPGAGKTTFLLGLVEEELARGVPPDRIGFFSFTRRAAQEAIERACKKFKLTEKDFPHFRTLHSMCFRQLGLNSGEVLERARLQEFGEYAGIRITGRTYMDEGSTFGFEMGDRIMFMENLARVHCVSLREQYEYDSDGLPWPEVQRVTDCLRVFKQKRHLLDYTDMLNLFAQSDMDLRLDVLFIDEVQDLSLLQWRVVEKLSKGCRRVVVAGDDDQAIYKWAGAAVEHFVGLEGSAQVLGQSWRVPRSVQAVSGEVISRVAERREKVWNPRDEEGSVSRVSSIHDLNFDGKDILVLARNGYILRDQVEPILRRLGVIYERNGFPSIKPGLLSAILSWEQLRKGAGVSAADVRRVYEFMSSGVGVARGHKTLPGVADETEFDMAGLKDKAGLLVDTPWFQALDRIPREDSAYIMAARRRGESLVRTPRVRLSTIHGAKGGEADHVVLMTEMARRTHEEMENKPEDEARVWYVGVTRARQQLTLVSSRARTYYDV